MDKVETAAHWRRQNGLVGQGGVVVIYKGEAAGWMNELRNPERWVPGCVAVAEDGRTWTTTGGTEQHGAMLWLPNDPVTLSVEKN